VRHIVSENELDYGQPLPGTDRPLADMLLEPHRCYLAPVRELRSSLDVRAIAHITGGGLKENVPRALPQGLGVELDRATWTVPPLFRAIQEAGGVHPDEMWRTFNMGIGMVVVVPAGQADAAVAAAGMPVHRIGRVVEQAAPERVVLR
jgi:phosphoribosylaminoimidazole (AIR) synthetase